MLYDDAIAEINRWKARAEALERALIQYAGCVVCVNHTQSCEDGPCGDFEFAASSFPAPEAAP